MYDGIAEHEGRKTELPMRDCLFLRKYLFLCFFLIYFY